MAISTDSRHPAWHHDAIAIMPTWKTDSAWKGHVPFAAWIVAVSKPQVLVELGTFKGLSYSAFCQAVRSCNAGTKCFAVDTWAGDPHAGTYANKIFTRLSRFHDRNYKDFSTLLRMTFDQALSRFDDQSVDLLHIDGYHTYDAVKHDFETWKPKLSANSVVLFHDTQVRKQDFGVWKFWSEVRQGKPSIEFTHSNGLGVLFMGQDVSDRAEALIAAMPDASADGPQAKFEAFAAAVEKTLPSEATKRNDPISKLLRSIRRRI